MVEYRRGKLRDLPVLASIMDESLREQGASEYSDEEISAIVNKNKGRMGRVLLGRMTPTVVAENSEGDVVGYAVVDANTCVLTQLYVRPSLVRDGVGSALLERAEDRAQELGCELLYIYASLNAIEFYKKQGYSEIERTTLDTETIEVPTILVQKTFGNNQPND